MARLGALQARRNVNGRKVGRKEWKKGGMEGWKGGRIEGSKDGQMGRRTAGQQGWQGYYNKYAALPSHLARDR